MSTNSEKLDQLLHDAASIKADLATLKSDMAEIEEAVFKGNGKPLLLARVEVNESQLSELRWYRRAALGALGTGLLSRLGWLAKVAL